MSLFDIFPTSENPTIKNDFLMSARTRMNLRQIKKRRVIKKFDDETATYEYVLQEYRNYGSIGLFADDGSAYKWVSTEYYGDIEWAKRIAKHYNCIIVEEEL